MLFNVSKPLLPLWFILVSTVWLAREDVGIIPFLLYGHGMICLRKEFEPLLIVCVSFSDKAFLLKMILKAGPLIALPNSVDVTRGVSGGMDTLNVCQ